MIQALLGVESELGEGVAPRLVRKPDSLLLVAVAEQESVLRSRHGHVEQPQAFCLCVLCLSEQVQWEEWRLERLAIDEKAAALWITDEDEVLGVPLVIGAAREIRKNDDGKLKSLRTMCRQEAHGIETWIGQGALLHGLLTDRVPLEAIEGLFQVQAPVLGPIADQVDQSLEVGPCLLSPVSGGFDRRNQSIMEEMGEALVSRQIADLFAESVQVATRRQ